MSFNSAVNAKERTGLWGSLLPDAVGETRNFSNAEKEAEILGTARKDAIKTVGDAQTNFYNQLGNQQAALQGSTNFADGLGIIGSGLSGGINTAFDFGLLKRKP